MIIRGLGFQVLRSILDFALVSEVRLTLLRRPDLSGPFEQLGLTATG
jgi:hypothetical protein